MIKVTKHGVLLQKTNHTFENEGVLNPAAIREGKYVHIFYRAVSSGNYSTIGYCKLDGPLNIVARMEIPLINAEHTYEAHGIEDPRIVKIDDLYYLTYTAYDGENALGALATSRDLVHFEKIGIIVPKITYMEFMRLTNAKDQPLEQYIYYNEHNRWMDSAGEANYLWDKNLIFFPRRIQGKLHFLHRIKPNIQIVVEVEELQELTSAFWDAYLSRLGECTVLAPKYTHESSYVGGGCPPIETPEGWLLIYHGVHNSEKGYIYSACAALLDLEHPKKELSRLPYPLFWPEYAWELKGEVNNVCFPTGSVLFDDVLYIYYGAADERVACASVSLSELLAELVSFSVLREG